MKFLIVGLGSMGKRRVRNLQSMGYKDIIGFDPRDDRRREAKEKYNIETVDELSGPIFNNSDAVIISTPPHRHTEYIDMSVENSKPCFVEVNVVLEGLPEVNLKARKKRVLVAPSCTKIFHPAIKTIKSIVTSGKYGKVTNFNFHSGTYLPDWHPWEKVTDFFVSQKRTGACREMVSFELTWLLDVMGNPQEIFAYYAKTLDFGADIDDVYTVLLKFRDFLGVLLVDVTSRFATRFLILNLEKAQIRWDWTERMVKVYDADTKRWIYYHDPKGSAAAGYNKNIIEEMYIAEIEAFIEAVKKGKHFPNTLDDDIKRLKMLEACEKTNKGARLK